VDIAQQGRCLVEPTVAAEEAAAVTVREEDTSPGLTNESGKYEESWLVRWNAEEDLFYELHRQRRHAC
jgi:hypothetical protein